ncbi:hypothetical protein ABMY26_05420 [Azospirillum sp. HJ39]|uniref:hypothetical protein n=1 Tax=Azospirillum sp. HJ39 TaxID=3159496 RepID=UPI003558C272
MDRKPDETIVTAHLPNLEIRIRHREAGEDGAEVIAIQFRATPSFDAVARLLAPALTTPLLPGGSFGTPGGLPGAGPMVEMWLAPMRLWGEMVRQAWAPWLQGGSAPRR